MWPAGSVIQTSDARARTRERYRSSRLRSAAPDWRSDADSDPEAPSDEPVSPGRTYFDASTVTQFLLQQFGIGGPGAKRNTTRILGEAGIFEQRTSWPE